ncbi:MAG TPA: ribosomal L7Ae/L30e/S12e/Gadd45 family protein [Candidatus Blautia stercoravium]|nr:ribosomal L7Ae/L30e/S12e/Gadd45 family protein [Candidatus Blautia stercoravium]
MNSHKELSLLGLAAKAGKIVSGEFATENAVKAGKAFLVLVAEDASDNTRKKFKDMCTYYEVPFYIIGTKEELGSAIGKEYRASLALTDENFAVATVEKLQKTGH